MTAQERAQGLVDLVNDGTISVATFHELADLAQTATFTEALRACYYNPLVW
jgi:hypothetical protein